jgi:hypothetical protein
MHKACQRRAHLQTHVYTECYMLQVPTGFIKHADPRQGILGPRSNSRAHSSCTTPERTAVGTQNCCGARRDTRAAWGLVLQHKFPEVGAVQAAIRQAAPKYQLTGQTQP